jgi:hypothetical protein
MLDLAGQDAGADGGSLCTFHELAGHLDEWRWRDLEARDLFIGGLFSDMLGGAAVGAVARQLIRRRGLPLPAAFVVLESTGVPVEGAR